MTNFENASYSSFFPYRRELHLPDWASINLIGVREAKRSQGSGTRLHAHLLARAAQEFGWHVGRTEAENHAMRRVFERNGSQEKARQLYFRPALPSAPQAAKCGSG